MPQTPRRTNPIDAASSARAPIRNSHSTLATDSTAQPVGLATVPPRPPGFQADAKSPTGRGRWPAAGGTRRRLGTAVSIIVRLATMIADQQRRSQRGRDGQRALAPAADVGLGADVRLRVAWLAGTRSAERCRGPGGRGSRRRRPGGSWRSLPAGRAPPAGAGRGRRNARTEAHASPRRPVKSADDELGDREHDQLQRCAAAGGCRPSAWRRSASGGGPAAGRGGGPDGGPRAPRGGAPGPAARRRPGPRSGGRASRGRRRRRGSVIAGSKPPRARNRSARTSRHADGMHEHVAHGVVLLLVVLPRLGDRIDLAEAVEAEPDVLQHVRRRPTTRAWDRRRRRSTGTAPRRASGSRRASSATSSWQKQKNPLSPSTSRSTSLAAAPEAGVGAEVADERVGQPGDDAPAQVGVAGGVDGPPVSRNSVLRFG